MRYHVYTEALHPDGDFAAGHVLTFYVDSMATTKATLYAGALGEPTRENPYTVPLSGMVDFWVYDENLWFVPQGSTTAYLVEINSASPLERVNVKDFGATGNGTTDDSAAFQAAIDYVQTNTTTGWAANPTARILIVVPAGDYLVHGLEIDDFQFLTMKGEGRQISRLISDNTAGPMIQIGGDFNAHPAHNYIGSDAQSCAFKDLTFECPSQAQITHIGTGEQLATGVQDNGAGGVDFEGCEFIGLKHGVYAPYGHDYVRYFGCDFNLCGIACYFGPGSQQLHMRSCTFGLCDQSIVLEGVLQASFDGITFNEPKTRDISIRNPTTFYSGVDPTDVMSAQETVITFSNLWFETGAGWSTGWTPTEHVRIGEVGDVGPIPPYWDQIVRGVTFRDVLLVSGTFGMGTKDPETIYSFLNVRKGSQIIIDHIQYSGTYIDAVVTHPEADNPHIIVRGSKLDDGYTDIPTFDPWTSGQTETEHWSNGYIVNKVRYPGESVTTLVGDDDHGWRIDSDGHTMHFMNKQGGTWYSRFRFDVGESRLCLGPEDYTRSIQWGWDAPTSGVYDNGDIIYNMSAAAGGYAGWICTTSGTAGVDAVFKTFGAITP